MSPDGGVAEPNVLVVCVDCLREDHLTTDAADTPFLDELRETGIAASNCFASATTTSPCVASLLTGTYAERNGVLSLDTGRLAPEVDAFAERFGDAGYHTEAFVTGPIVEETGLDRGFDAFRYREPEASLFTDWRDIIQNRLGELPTPFAAYVHLWEIHEDVHVPPAFDDPEYGATPYARALSALDRELEQLFDVVSEDTIVVVHGDHGESITCRYSPVRLGLKALRDALRYYGGIDTRSVVARLNRALGDRGADVPDHYLENGHGENVYDFVANVPLLITGPGISPGTVDAQVRQIDVLPTLLELADLDPHPPMDGSSILGDIADRPAYMRACGASLHRRRNWARAVRADGYKYVEYPDRDWSPELYDLAADPLELDSVADPDRERQLRTHLPDEALDDGEHLDVEDRLEKLGYR